MAKITQRMREDALRTLGKDIRQTDKLHRNQFESLSRNCHYLGGKSYARECTHPRTKLLGRQQGILLYCHFCNCPFKNGRI